MTKFTIYGIPNCEQLEEVVARIAKACRAS